MFRRIVGRSVMRAGAAHHRCHRLASLAALAAMVVAPTMASAQWRLTPAYQPGGSTNPWAISTLTGGFYTGGSEPYEDQGWYCVFGFAYGFAANYNGGKPYFMVARVYNGSSSYANNGGLVVFNSDVDGQPVPYPITPLETPIGLASIGGKVYAAFPGNDVIAQVNPDGTHGPSIGQGLSSVNGLTVNPRNGHVYATNWANNTILDIDVNAKTVKTLMTMKDLNGVTITGGTGLATDGSSLYVVLYTSDGDHVEQFPIPATDGQTVTSVNDFGFIYGARGVALGTGGTSGYVYVNCRHGMVYQIDRATKNISLLANWYSKGNLGGFAGVDPINGSLLMTGTAVGRLTPPVNQSLQYTIPTVAASSVASGKTMQGTVYLAVPAPVDFIVTLVPSPNVKVSAKTVTIKAGTTSATFQVTGGVVTASAPATVGTSITLPIGIVTQTVQFTVTPH